MELVLRVEALTRRMESDFDGEVEHQVLRSGPLNWTTILRNFSKMRWR